MSAPHSDGAHGHARCLFRTGAGQVSVCGCGVVTLTMQQLSLRLTPDAFRELALLLAHAQHQLDRSGAPVADDRATPPETQGEPMQARSRLH